MADLDRVIHESWRLRIVAILAGVERADFNFLLNTLGLSRGNLASHVDKLERAGYVDVIKGYRGKTPRTEYRLTPVGRAAWDAYWVALDAIRAQSRAAAGSKRSQQARPKALKLGRAAGRPSG